MIDNSLYLTIDKLKAQLEQEIELQDVLKEKHRIFQEIQEEWEQEKKELKKENIKLRSLNRRAAEEIRDLDNILIDCVENNKTPEYDEPEPMFAGFSSINLLNRLDGRTNGGYIENYEDLYLELKKLEYIEQPETRVAKLIKLYEEGKYAEFLFGTKDRGDEVLLEIAPLLVPAMKKLRERDEKKLRERDEN